MTTRKSNDYKITAVNYYLVEDKTQEEVCKIFKCNSVGLKDIKKMGMLIFIIENHLLIKLKKICKIFTFQTQILSKM